MIKRAAEAGRHLFFLGPFVRMPRLLASSRGAVSAAAGASRERGAGRASRAGWGACAAWRYAFLSAFSPTRSSRGRRSVRSAFCTAWLQAAAAPAQASCPGSVARGASRSAQHPRRRVASTLPRSRAPRVTRASSVALHARHGCHEGVTSALHTSRAGARTVLRVLEARPLSIKVRAPLLLALLVPGTRPAASAGPPPPPPPLVLCGHAASLTPY